MSGESRGHDGHQHIQNHNLSDERREKEVKDDHKVLEKDPITCISVIAFIAPDHIDFSPLSQEPSILRQQTNIEQGAFFRIVVKQWLNFDSIGLNNLESDNCHQQN